jgi:uncharacterized protein (DUF2062 family)
MSRKNRASSRPPWVRLALFGLHTRLAATLCLWLSVILVLVSVAGGILLHPWLFVGVVFLGAALGYWLAIRWVDENDRWAAQT